MEELIDRLSKSLGFNIPAAASFFLSLSLLIVFGIVFYMVLKKLTIHFFKRLTGKGRGRLPESKARTYETLTISVLKYATIILIVLEVLNRFGLSRTVSSLFATAGIGGLALGIGAKDTITDMLTGFFLLTEDQIAVGDYVTIGSYTGTVEAIKIRVTHIRAYTGELQIINNGQIKEMTNYSKKESLALVEIPIPFECDLDKAIKVMDNEVKETLKENKSITGIPKVLGISDVTDKGAVIRITCETKPMEHYDVERAMRLAALNGLKKAGMTIGYSKLQIMKEDVWEKK